MTRDAATLPFFFLCSPASHKPVVLGAEAKQANPRTSRQTEPKSATGGGNQPATRPLTADRSARVARLAVYFPLLLLLPFFLAWVQALMVDGRETDEGCLTGTQPAAILRPHANLTSSSMPHA